MALRNKAEPVLVSRHHRLDYCFVSGTVVVDNARVVMRGVAASAPPSDHYGLLVELVLVDELPQLPPATDTQDEEAERELLRLQAAGAIRGLPAAEDADEDVAEGEGFAEQDLRRARAKGETAELSQLPNVWVAATEGLAPVRRKAAAK
jgi:hypothetical protein